MILFQKISIRKNPSLLGPEGEKLNKLLIQDVVSIREKSANSFRIEKQKTTLEGYDIASKGYLTIICEVFIIPQRNYKAD